MKPFNAARRFGSKLGNVTRNASIAAAVTVIASPAFAALPEGVTTQMTEAKADATEGGGLVIGALAVVAGIALVIAIFRKA